MEGVYFLYTYTLHFSLVDYLHYAKVLFTVLFRIAPSAN